MGDFAGVWVSAEVNRSRSGVWGGMAVYPFIPLEAASKDDRLFDEAADVKPMSLRARGDGRVVLGMPMPKPDIDPDSILGVPALEVGLEMEALESLLLAAGDFPLLRKDSPEGVPSYELNAENLDMGCDASPRGRCKFGLRDESPPTTSGRLEAAILGGPITSVDDSAGGGPERTSCRLPSRIESYIELSSWGKVEADEPDACRGDTEVFSSPTLEPYGALPLLLAPPTFEPVI